MMTGALTIGIWNEGIHERTDAGVAAIYPDGMDGAIAEGLGMLLPAGTVIHRRRLEGSDTGLTSSFLDGLDVLVWWGHLAHDAVDDQTVARIVARVHAGMGLIVLHSGHFSRIFIRLMGTTCSLSWRNDGAREVLWTVEPTHPIAAGLEGPIVLEAHEMYGEFFDIPRPDDIVFISGHDGGEVFRSGVTFTRGRGRIFYFSPGDENYPVFFHAGIRQVLANAVRWARPRSPIARPYEAEHPPRGWFSGSSDIR